MPSDYSRVPRNTSHLVRHVYLRSKDREPSRTRVTAISEEDSSQEDNWHFLQSYSWYFLQLTRLATMLEWAMTSAD